MKKELLLFATVWISSLSAPTWAAAATTDNRFPMATAIERECSNQQQASADKALASPEIQAAVSRFHSVKIIFASNPRFPTDVHVSIRRAGGRYAAGGDTIEIEINRAQATDAELGNEDRCNLNYVVNSVKIADAIKEKLGAGPAEAAAAPEAPAYGGYGERHRRHAYGAPPAGAIAALDDENAAPRNSIKAEITDKAGKESLYVVFTPAEVPPAAPVPAGKPE